MSKEIHWQLGLFHTSNHPKRHIVGKSFCRKLPARQIERFHSLKENPRKTNIIISHRIHVWYIYLHLVVLYGKCIGKNIQFPWSYGFDSNPKNTWLSRNSDTKFHKCVLFYLPPNGSFRQNPLPFFFEKSGLKCSPSLRSSVKWLFFWGKLVIFMGIQIFSTGFHESGYL